MVFGIGTDIVLIDRIKNLFVKYHTRFPQKILSARELQNFCNLDKLKQVNYLAKRFAAKEAFSKAFGSGIGARLSFQDIEIYNNKAGGPEILLNVKIQKQISYYKTHLSFSDECGIVVAFVVISK